MDKTLTTALALFTFALAPIVSAAPAGTVDIDQLVASMTDEEKVDFIGGIDNFSIRAVPRLGIPEVRMDDGPMGVRADGDLEAYPAGIGLAATWDREVAHAIGRSIGAEARSRGIDIMLAPAVNIYRMPLCGRNFEYFGEDPYLAGQTAVPYIEGLQSQGVSACVKHFAANNQEFDRNNCSSDVDERTLQEIYLPAFRAAVEEAHVGTVMTSYNPVNGVHASQNGYLIRDILKGAWSFDGFVMSDWVSTYDGVACALGGLDLEMPSGALMNRETLLPALRNGVLPRRVLDDKVRRILGVYQRFGFFDPERNKDCRPDRAALKQAALAAARGGMVLLKNDDQTLPLDSTQLRKIAVVGPNALAAVTGGGGSSHVDATNPVSLGEAVRRIVGDKTEVVVEEGIHAQIPMPEGVYGANDFHVHRDGRQEPGVQVEYFDNPDLQGTPALTRFYPNINFSADAKAWDDFPRRKLFSLRFTCYFTPPATDNYCLCVSGDDGYRLYLDGELKTDAWRPQGETPSRADVALTGGREYKVVVDYYQSGGDAVVRIGALRIGPMTPPAEYLSRALAAARSADVVILAVGFNSRVESEGSDRTFELPYDQAAFIRQVAAANPRTVVVLNSGGNVEMESWLGSARALLEAWYPGTEGNLAAAEILFGRVNPSGKLPASFARSLEENPCHGSYFDTDKDLRVAYREGIFLGYRHWDRSGRSPRFAFGHGLSYTKFAYANLTTDKREYSRDEPVEVSLEVTNVGDRDGAEIAELYVGQRDCALPRPLKELKGYAKKFVKVGETVRMTFTLMPSAFAYYDPQKHAWTVDAGEFTLSAGASSADIRQTAVITLR